MPKVEQLWQRVRKLIESRQSKAYDEAVSHLLDLQAIAALQNNSTTFQEKIDDIAEEFSRKRSLIARLKKADLI